VNNGERVERGVGSVEGKRRKFRVRERQETG
jgi:hypothetical protein